MPEYNFCISTNDENKLEPWEEQPITIPMHEYVSLREDCAVLECKYHAVLLENNGLKSDLEKLFDDLQTLRKSLDVYLGCDE